MKKSIVYLFTLFLSQTVWSAGFFECPAGDLKLHYGVKPYSDTLHRIAACLPPGSEGIEAGTACPPGYEIFNAISLMGARGGGRTRICIKTGRDTASDQNQGDEEYTEEVDTPREAGDYTEREEECKSKSENTVICCGNPIQCASDAADVDIGLSGEEMNILSGFLGSGLAAAGVQGAQQSCSKLEWISKAVGGVNAGLGALCQGKIISCRDSCDALEKSASEEKEALPVTSRNRRKRQKLRRIITRAKNNSDDCSRQTEKVEAHAAAVLQAVNVAAQSKLCIDESKAEDDPDIDPPIESCGDPVYYEHPVCKNCSNPKVAAINPNCTKSTEGQTKAQTVSADYGGRANEEGLELDARNSVLGDPSQGLNLQDAKAEATRANFSDHKGGGVPGGGEPAGGGGGGARGGYSGSNNFNTDIIGGTGGSSGGYSNKAGGNGYAVQQKDSRFGTKEKSNKFNLKSYLPGGAKDPNRRIASQRRIAGKYDDIFKRITKRVYHLCGHNRLYDCSNYKGRKPKGL